MCHCQGAHRELGDVGEPVGLRGDVDEGAELSEASLREIDSVSGGITGQTCSSDKPAPKAGTLTTVPSSSWPTWMSLNLILTSFFGALGRDARGFFSEEEASLEGASAAAMARRARREPATIWTDCLGTAGRAAELQKIVGKRMSAACESVEVFSGSSSSERVEALTWSPGRRSWPRGRPRRRAPGPHGGHGEN